MKVMAILNRLNSVHTQRNIFGMKSCNLTIDVYHHFLISYVHYRPVLPGGASNAMAPLGGADYVHQITTGTPGFSDLPTALQQNVMKSILRMHHNSNSAIIQFDFRKYFLKNIIKQAHQGPFKYYVGKWQFLLIYSTIYADVSGWVGLKKPKTHLRHFKERLGLNRW